MKCNSSINPTFQLNYNQYKYEFYRKIPEETNFIALSVANQLSPFNQTHWKSVLEWIRSSWTPFDSYFVSFFLLHRKSNLHVWTWIDSCTFKASHVVFRQFVQKCLFTHFFFKNIVKNRFKMPRQFQKRNNVWSKKHQGRQYDGG